jgi:bifunctional non-homologous end joining protein LigD
MDLRAKFDGERCLSFRLGNAVRLLSRNRLSANEHIRRWSRLWARQEARDFVVDGEVVAFEGHQTSFARLQRRMHVRDPNRARRTGAAVTTFSTSCT